MKNLLCENCISETFCKLRPKQLITSGEYCKKYQLSKKYPELYTGE